MTVIFLFMIFSPPSFTFFIPATVYIVERLMHAPRKFQSIFYNVYIVLVINCYKLYTHRKLVERKRKTTQERMHFNCLVGTR
jgi:hypothetical protein